MIKELFAAGKSTLSFEVFPPKKDADFATAYATLDALAALSPDFIRVTYGAGGRKSKKTLEIASYIQNTLHLETLAHLTCVGNKKEDILAVAKDLSEKGIHQVLALRGDRPKDMTDEQYEGRDFSHASDLITFLRANTSLQCAAACYPEKHFECFSKETDLYHLKLKQDAGADFFITQLFFDNDYYYDFMDRAIRKGITIPICAGIMPVTSATQLGTTVSLSGSSIPKAFSDLIARYGDNPEDMRKAGIDYAIRQILDLRLNGVKDIHLYTMNKPRMAAEIVAGLNHK